MGEYISLKKNVDFRRLYRRGITCVTPSLVIYALPNREKVHRLGITAGKKVGGATKRNRAKRRIRALFREFILGLDDALRHYDFVVVARARCVSSPYEKLKHDFYCAASEVLSPKK